MENLFLTVADLLKSDERFFTAEGKLIRNALYEAAMKMDASLIKVLLGNEDTRKQFFSVVEIDGKITYVFDKVEFGWFVNNKEFLPDSYTRYKNKIGLADDRGELLTSKNEIELVFPFKDCVLVGEQTSEEEKRNEIFYNKYLSSKTIDRLLMPKVLVKSRRINKNGNELTNKILSDDNLVIKGNNLMCLASLLERYTNRVQCICIDPPYNTSSSGFGYNDSFNHSSWMTFMKNRLETSYKLLSSSGTIFVFCDDNEQAYLKILMDSIFGRERYIQTVVWRNCDNSNNDAKQFSQDHNYILVYSKNENWESIKLDRTEDQAKHYKNPDNDPRGPWFDGNPVNSPNPRKNLMYDIVAPNGNVIHHPANGWRWKKVELEERMATGEIRFNEAQTNIIRRTYLFEQKGLPPSSLWNICDEPFWFDIDETGHTRQAKYEQKKLYPGLATSELFKTPKPEKVIKKILDISTSPQDIVLDFFGGSGTLAAVAHKMKRQYILCEQMDYVEQFIVKRLKKVIDGEQGGISKAVNWQGGGSFVYCELAQLNQKFVDELQDADTDEKVKDILVRLLKTGFISDRVVPKLIDVDGPDFNALSLEQKKDFVMQVIDANMLYVNYSDIDDEEFNISEEDKAFTRSFYGEN